MINTNEDAWIEVAAWAAKELNNARTELEGINCDPRRADQLRGVIQTCTLLIELPTRKEIAQDTASSRYLF